MSLVGKICIITGAGRGIGRAAALRFTTAGAHVVAAARSEPELRETAAQCKKHPGRCVVQVTDVTIADQVDRLIDACQTEFGRLDILVNNAGVAPLVPFGEMGDEVFEQVVAVNIRGVYLTSRRAWPLLRASKGTIVNISSLAADDPFPGFAAYGPSKTWVNGFSRALANEGKADGITVFAVAPGAVETEMMRAVLPDFPAEQTLAPDDVAATIEVLLDDRCRYATGQVVTVKR